MTDNTEMRLYYTLSLLHGLFMLKYPREYRVDSPEWSDRNTSNPGLTDLQFLFRLTDIKRLTFQRVVSNDLLDNEEYEVRKTLKSTVKHIPFTELSFWHQAKSDTGLSLRLVAAHCLDLELLELIK